MARNPRASKRNRKTNERHVDRAALRKILFSLQSPRAKDAIAMNDQSPPPNWFLRPQSGPYWMPNAVWNGGLTPPAKDRFDPSTWTPSTWDPST